MSFRIVDEVTRRAIKEGEPVVAFLLNRSKQYPYQENPNEAPIYPCDMYSFESLPIRGTYDGYGGIKPLTGEESIAVQVARAQVGGLTWEKLMSTRVGESYQLLGKPGDDNRRSYGLFIVQEQTFDQVCAAVLSHRDKAASLAQEREKDVGLILHLVNRYLSIPTKGRGEYTEEEQDRLYQGLQVCGLRTSIGFADDGTKLEMPALARVLESDMFGSDIRDALRSLQYLSNLGTREPKPCSTIDVPGYRDLLEALWLTQLFYHGLDLLDVTVAPSKRTRSAGAAAKLQLGAMHVETLVRERLSWATDGYGDIDDLPALEADVRVVSDVAGRLEEALETVRTGLAED